jgi:lathosterol oxidase
MTADDLRGSGGAEVEAASRLDRPEFHLGDGKASGVLGVLLGWLGLGAVVTMRFPGVFSTPDLRLLYPLPIVRAVVGAVLVAGLACAVVSLVLGRRKSRGFLGLALGGLAVTLGGAGVPIEAPSAAAPYLALDWFLLSLAGLALVFVPLERLFARVRQRVFRPGWRTDLAHFGVSHLLVQITVFLTLLPATFLFRWAVSDRLHAWVAAQPVWLQFVEALFVADLFAYLAHRAFHEVPFLWRFHQVHHSSEALDWLAGSRLHLVDVVITRAFGFVPLYVLGFAPAAIVAYLTWASFHAVFIHANLRFRFGLVRYLLATPQFHHWHHSTTLYDKNFAVHLPLIDRLFGTFHLPGDDWPDSYGIEGRPVPDGYLRQLVHPLMGANASEPPDPSKEPRRGVQAPTRRARPSGELAPRSRLRVP